MIPTGCSYTAMMDVLLLRVLLHCAERQPHLTQSWFHPAVGKSNRKVKGTAECPECSLANPEIPGDEELQAITI